MSTQQFKAGEKYKIEFNSKRVTATIQKVRVKGRGFTVYFRVHGDPTMYTASATDFAKASI